MKAHELLSDESKWLRGWFAVNQHGERVFGTEPGACKFCVVGALQKCYGEDRFEVLRKVLTVIGRTDIGTWNDAPERTFDEVKALLVKLDI